VAGREKDRDYLRAAVRHGLLDRETLLTRLAATPIEPDARARLQVLIASDFA
jgi:hypothetical protein